MPSMSSTTFQETEDLTPRPKTAPIPPTLESPRANPRITSAKPPPPPRGLYLRYTALLFKHYKITKIVRALWLAERSVCMRVCKHGCGVKLFGFSRANHASTNLKKFSSSKLKKFTLFTHFLIGWNLENRSKEGVYIFLRLSWPF